MAFMNPPSSASGEFVPILSYNAVSGRLSLRDRVQNASGDWEAKETDVTMSQTSVRGGLRRTQSVGWCHFVKGAAPQWAMVPYGQPMPERPASPGMDATGKTLNFRNGFRVPVAGNAIGGVRELAGNSAALIDQGMNALHTEYEAAPEASQGKNPGGEDDRRRSRAWRGAASSYRNRHSQVQSWVDRPDVLGPRTVAPPGPAPRAVQSAPATERRAALAMADEMPF